MRIKYIFLFSIFSTLISCGDNNSKKSSLDGFLIEYNESKGYEDFDEGFSEAILLERKKLLSERDFINLARIDSILLESEAGGSFAEQKAFSQDTILEGRSCGAVDNAPLDALRIRSNSLKLPMDDIEIPIAYHVIHESGGKGKVSQETLLQQHQVLNETFSSTFIRFKLNSIDYTENDKWYSKVDEENIYEEQMHKSLGASNDEFILHVYTVGPLTSYGYAKFPWKDRTSFDGVVIRNSTLPGGSLSNFNQGKTLTHEIGHYLGLWHTFHKGCKIGDDVYDTPPQAIRTRKCPKGEGKDTCNDDFGDDMIENYMDLSFDRCLDSFTGGQIERMNWAIRKHRKGLLPPLQ